MKRVTGLGGVFFKTSDPKKIKEWYGTHLGLPIDEYGASFKWIDIDNKEAKEPALTAWSPFARDTKYFEPSEKQFMFNYRVENLVELLKVLKEEGVEIVGEMQEFPYGKFGWIMDPEGNKIELWEPKDDGF
ncbi:MAG: VOC family protein [Cyclobacteriaceae bacterium]|nr:VOC family protein [Cyclobacteriaceae bacterium]